MNTTLTMAETQAPPTVQAISSHVGRGGIRTVEIRCPFCRRRHTHGWPEGQSTIGGRLSHCRQDPRPYIVLPPANHLEEPS